MAVARTVVEDCAIRDRVLSEFLVSEAGITYRQMDYWCRTGSLESEGGGSSGVPRTFARCEVPVAALLGRLSRLGLSPTSEIAQRAAIVARAGRGGVVTDGPLTVFIA